jgi:hypothetical protein
MTAATALNFWNLFVSLPFLSQTKLTGQRIKEIIFYEIAPALFHPDLRELSDSWSEVAMMYLLIVCITAGKVQGRIMIISPPILWSE